MSDTVIRVENLSKKYIIGHQHHDHHGTLRDAITDTARSLFRPRSIEHQIPSKEEFWALKEVAFEIKQGDRVGIIGRNGAGKSTLLKILSRITEPTHGSIKIRGRVASLLEVGTGFHPELTGRENIFLNGAILGMSKAEIRRKFDEIVAFAEIEKFLDTPVKRYSSGMYVRLAFAVAAHLDSEVLIVDEVLAVGDAQFQKKSLGKMEALGKDGRTVLFVSHSMGTITQLCKSAIYLKSGEVALFSDINTAVASYLKEGKHFQGRVNLVHDSGTTHQKKQFFFKTASILNHKGVESLEVDVRFPFFLNLEYEIVQCMRNLELSVEIWTADGRPVTCTCQSHLSPEVLEQREIGTYQASIQFPEMFLVPGSYMATFAAYDPIRGEVFDMHEHILHFTVLETGTKLAIYGQDPRNGVVLLEIPWVAKQLDAQIASINTNNLSGGYH
jgi:lipopolysaccharide transport system ATP-binding protein